MNVIKYGTYIFLLIIFNETCYAQFSERVYIKVSKIYKADKDNILDHSIRSSGDSIQAYRLENDYCFFFKIRELNIEPFAKLFKYNGEEDKLTILIDSLLYFGNNPTNNLGIFYKNIFIYDLYDTDFDNGKIGGIRIRVLNIHKNTIKKIIHFPRGTVWRDIYIIKDKLFISTQTLKAERNIDYYFFFWLPRGAPTKWNYIEAGNKILYTLDKDFNIIKQEEIKEKKEE